MGVEEEMGVEEGRDGLRGRERRLMTRNGNLGHQVSEFKC